MTQELNKECRSQREVWFSNTPLTIVGALPAGEGYTKESIEWAYGAGFQAGAAWQQSRLPDEELVERVAKALTRWRGRKLQDPLPDWDTLTEAEKAAYLDQAAFALAAIAEIKKHMEGV